MKVVTFLRDKAWFICLQISVILFTTILLSAIRVNGYTICFLCVCYGGATIFSLLFEFIRKNCYYRQVRKCLEALDQKYLLSEMISQPGFSEGAFFYETLQICCKSMNDRIARYHIASEEYREYIET